MNGKSVGICLALLIITATVLHAEKLARHWAPAISHIEPLNEGCALVQWDSIDASAVRMQVQISQRSWGDFLPCDEGRADLGFMVITGLEPRRSYRLRLVATSASDMSAPGPIMDYRHAAPPVNWVFIPGTVFDMGGVDADAAPRHPVRLSGYLLSATEVTNAQYAAFCVADSLPLPADPGFAAYGNYTRQCPQCPVVKVSWHNAAAYCNYLSKQMNLPLAYAKDGNLQSNQGVRLPSEAEWEHAAGLANGVYPWGNAAPDSSRANFKDTTHTHIVKNSSVAIKSFPAAPAGLYDLAGNVWEWCHDWYAPYSASLSDSLDPLGPIKGEQKVVRGGSWADEAEMLKVVNRGRLSPNSSLSTVGLRVARSFPVSPPHVMNAAAMEGNHEPAK